MACNNWGTIKLDCLDEIAGVDWIAAMKENNLDRTSLTNGVTIDTTAHTITDIALVASASTNLFQEIQLAENSSNWVENRQFTLSNGSHGWELQLTANVPKNDGATRFVLNNMVKSRNIILIKNNDGRYYLGGLRKGGYWTGGSTASGQAVTDLNGASLVFTSYENTMMYEVSSAIVSALINAA